MKLSRMVSGLRLKIGVPKIPVSQTWYLKWLLAHAVENAVEAAYRRGDLFEKRVRLMDAWADHLNNVEFGSNVNKITSIGKAGA